MPARLVAAWIIFASFNATVGVGVEEAVDTGGAGVEPRPGEDIDVVSSDAKGFTVWPHPIASPTRAHEDKT